MSAIRIRKHLDSDTLHLPELRGMIGRDVEIIVRHDAPLHPSPTQLSNEFWNPPSVEELAKRQGHLGPFEFNSAFGSMVDADWEGFDEYLEEIRRPPQENGRGG